MSYLLDSLRNVSNVGTDGRVLAIISGGKLNHLSDIEHIHELAKSEGLAVRHHTLVCEDGILWPHLLVADESFTIAASIGMIGKTKEGKMDRANLQHNMGILFGYDGQKIGDFVESEVGLTCPCDCCGGPNVSHLDNKPKQKHKQVPTFKAKFRASVPHDHDEDILDSRRTKYHADPWNERPNIWSREL